MPVWRRWMTIGRGWVVEPVAIGPVWRRRADRGWDLPALTLGWDVLAWTAKYLTQPDGPDAGQPWQYTDEQARAVLWWFAIDATGQFLYRYGTVRRVKGWGKDPFAASLAAVELLGPCRFDRFDPDTGLPVGKAHPAAWVQVAAVSRDQTRNTLTLFPGLFSREAIEQYSIDLGKEIIYARGGRCRIEAVTSSPRALEGGRSTFVIKNESHHWLLANSGHDMAKVISRNLGKSRDGAARALAITNAHLPGEDSDAEHDWTTYESGVDGRADVSDRFYDSLEAPQGLDPTDPEQVRAGIVAARGDSTWLHPDRITREFLDLTTLTQGEAIRFYWNQIQGSDAAWIDLDAWTDRRAEVELADRERVCLGFDGSLRHDSTALVACRLVDGHVWPLHIWEKPRGPAGNGWQVPREEVAAAVDDAFRTFDVIRMYCDPPHWQDYVDKWAASYGEKVVLEFWTMSAGRMAKALERLHTAITAGEMTHNGDETLTRHVGNAVAVKRAGGVQINKRKDGDKIDALVSAVLAYEARNDAIADGALVADDVNFWSWDEL